MSLWIISLKSPLGFNPRFFWGGCKNCACPILDLHFLPNSDNYVDLRKINLHAYGEERYFLETGSLYALKGDRYHCFGLESYSFIHVVLIQCLLIDHFFYVILSHIVFKSLLKMF